VLYTVLMSAIQDKANRHVSSSCKYPVVCCPKYRRNVLVNGIDGRLKQIITDVCEDHQAEIRRMEIMPDHVHLLVEGDPPFGIHRLVRLRKGRSSRLLRHEFPVLVRTLPTL